MARKNEIPQKAAMREMMSVLPDEEPDRELGCSQYDYRNKDTDKSRNGRSTKTTHTSLRGYRIPYEGAL